MYIFEKIAERRIEEAMKRGEFDNLSLKGQPLPPDGMERIPEELRMSYKILKNSGIIPEEVELRKHISNLNDLLETCDDEIQKKMLRKKLNEKQLRYRMIMESKGIAINLQYHEKIMNKLDNNE